MAKRLCFISRPEGQPLYEEVLIEFDYFNGFAVSQKQKSINALHKGIGCYDPCLQALEVSTKSEDALGVSLSAFNLKIYDVARARYYAIENVFQASKVFENGGPYLDLMNCSPKDAKRDERLQTSGSLIGFSYNGIHWPLEPKSMFYDWLYIHALKDSFKETESLLKYDVFTDIEFNQKKSYNCQARSVAIFVSLIKTGRLETYLANLSLFKGIYQSEQEEVHQYALFDWM